MPPDTLTSADAAKEPPVLETLKRFLPYLWPAGHTEHKVRISLAGIIILASKGVQLSMGFLYGAAIDRMAPGMEPGVALAIGLVLAYAGARFAGVLFDNLRNVVFERVGQDATRELAITTFSHLHALSLRFHLARRTGEVTKVIERGTKSIDTMLYFLLFNIAPTIIELLAVLIIFWTKFSFGLASATALMVVVYIIFTRKVTDWRNALRTQMNDLDTLTIGRSVDSLLNYETVKYFGAEAREEARYRDVADRYARAAVKSENSLAWLNIGQSLITNAALAGAMAYTVWGWSTGEYKVGDVVLVNTLLAQLFRPLDMLGMVYRVIRQGLIDMEAMFRLIDTPSEIEDAPGALPLVVNGGAVAFDNVMFGYEPDRTILNGVSFAVGAGETLAIVGPSGAGKSTIARLLFRFYDPQGGRVLIDGQDVRAVTQASLRRAIGIVPQDTVLFNDTIGYTPDDRPRRRRRGRDCRGGRGRGDRRLYRHPAAGLRHRSRRAGAEAVGRRETARRDRAHPAQKPAGADFGRSDQRARQPHRGGDPGHARPHRAAPHDFGDRAPPVDGDRRRPHHRAG